MSKVRLDFWVKDREDVANEIYLDLIIKRDYSKPDKPVVSMWQGKQSRPFSRFYYTSIQRAEAVIEREKNKADGRKAYAEEKKAEKEMIKTMKPSLKVGDVLTGSYGYEQTNVEFYTVLEIKNKTIKIQELGQYVEEEGFMQGKTTPNLNSRKGEVLTKRVQMRSYGNSSIKEYVKLDSCIRLTKWDGQPKFCSWYA